MSSRLYNPYSGKFFTKTPYLRDLSTAALQCSLRKMLVKSHEKVIKPLNKGVDSGIFKW